MEDGMRMKPLVASLAMLLFLGVAGPASAQSFQGGMRGAIKDAQGVIPGVTAYRAV